VLSTGRSQHPPGVPTGSLVIDSPHGDRHRNRIRPDNATDVRLIDPEILHSVGKREDMLLDQLQLLRGWGRQALSPALHLDRAVVRR
jgi:hypothetical protein